MATGAEGGSAFFILGGDGASAFTFGGSAFTGSGGGDGGAEGGASAFGGDAFSAGPGAGGSGLTVFPMPAGVNDVAFGGEGRGCAAFGSATAGAGSFPFFSVMRRDGARVSGDGFAAGGDGFAGGGAGFGGSFTRRRAGGDVGRGTGRAGFDRDTVRSAGLGAGGAGAGFGARGSGRGLPEKLKGWISV
ncbi:MAG: hypothetical protein ACE5IM_14525 [Nitrospinota bacterium]